MKTICVALAFLLLALQYQIWFTPAGVVSIWKLSHALENQKIENSFLEKRNDTLIADIKDLKNGDQSVEDHARNDLGMIKEGEVFYQELDH